jgi:hypothetical protein
MSNTDVRNDSDETSGGRRASVTFDFEEYILYWMATEAEQFIKSVTDYVSPEQLSTAVSGNATNG